LLQRTAYCTFSLKTLLLSEQTKLFLKEVKAKPIAHDV